MSTKFTPGPDRVRDKNSCKKCDGVGLVYNSIVDEMVLCPDCLEKRRRMRDAQGDMLAALEAVEMWWLEQGMHEVVGGAPACIFAARAALAKARGE